jgi:hypothetical protein
MVLRRKLPTSRKVDKPKPAQLTLPDWYINPDDFIYDDLADYIDPHVAAILSDVEVLIPEKYFDKVFVAGGFAACTAGVTKTHNDVDIFCNEKGVFNILFQMLEDNLAVTANSGIIDNDRYGRLFKFTFNEQKFDLVDITTITGSNCDVRGLLMSFDINWAMAAIILRTKQIWIHPEALSEDIKINTSNIKHFDGSNKRIQKYSERLVRPVNKPLVKKTRKILHQMLQKKLAREKKEKKNSWDS